MGVFVFESGGRGKIFLERMQELGVGRLLTRSCVYDGGGGGLNGPQNGGGSNCNAGIPGIGGRGRGRIGGIGVLKKCENR